MLTTTTGFAADNNSASAQEIHQRVSLWLSEYLPYDSQGKDRGIFAGNDFLPLYDLNDQVIAYMIPLYDSNSIEVGYLITSATLSGPVMCEMTLDNTLFSDYQCLLLPGEKLLYLDIMQFGIQATSQSTNNAALQIYDINDTNLEAFNNTRAHETMSLNTYDNPLDQFLIEINSSNSERFATTILSRNACQTLSRSTTVTINYDSVDLNFGSLVTGYYGGNQDWWTDSRANYGCGTVAAANALAYLAMYHNAPSLYIPSSHSKTSYISHMNYVEQCVHAGIGGRPDPYLLMEDVLQYGATYLEIDKYMSSYIFDGVFDFDNICDFLIEALSNDYPVLFYQLLGAYSEYDMHWMTITKFFQNSGGTYIAISTWGERRSLDFELVIDGATLNHSFLYFTID